ncbi:small acid-soluble spore protein Tlp [Paenibacillus sabinae]|uniref:Small, acid-soluble spore protein tlp n=1 Tax=Paenibacillus sabinae T27 TaxID=1268072 RepID=X4ZNW8_9BACL|nr:small acid-soluble spore protein Tlp [Paenibacillus sabinae]AHV98265.1 small, acid-soluble spore protein tlp [Paenibacillus sabinae T27]
MNRPKPDNREDNVAHLQNNIENTIRNYRETEEYLNEHRDEISSAEKNQLQDKNERRLNSIEGFREEVKDEARNQNK